MLSLPKDLYPPAKYVPITSEWLFDDDINTRINNIKAPKKAFKVDKTYFKPGMTFYRQVYFPKQNQKKTWEISENPWKSIQGVHR